MAKFAVSFVRDPAPPEFQSNGCGPARFGWAVPDYRFHKCCHQHDWEYHLGGTEEDRKRADDSFLACTRATANTLSRWRRPVVKAAAWVYYRAVRIGGGKAYNYRESRYPVRGKDIPPSVSCDA